MTPAGVIQLRFLIHPPSVPSWNPVPQASLGRATGLCSGLWRGLGSIAGLHPGLQRGLGSARLPEEPAPRAGLLPGLQRDLNPFARRPPNLGTGLHTIAAACPTSRESSTSSLDIRTSPSCESYSLTSHLGPRLFHLCCCVTKRLLMMMVI